MQHRCFQSRSQIVCRHTAVSQPRVELRNQVNKSLFGKYIVYENKLDKNIENEILKVQEYVKIYVTAIHEYHENHVLECGLERM